LGIACSLVYSSSDYSGASTALGANGIPADAFARVFVLFGDRDQPPEIAECYDTKVADVLYTDVRGTGVLDPWRHANPTPVVGVFRGAVVNDALVAFGLGPDESSSPAVVRAPITADGVGEWSVFLGDALSGGPANPMLAFGGPAGYLLGGTVDLSADGGSCSQPVADSQYVPVDPATGDPGTTKPATPLSTLRSYVSTVAYGSTLYLIGGYDPSIGPLPTVEMAPIASDGSLGAYQKLADLPDGEGGTYDIESPSVCAGEGHLFVVGGDLGGDRSDVVLGSAIQPDGTLGPWAVFTSMPGTHYNGGCFVAGSRLYVLGGEGTTARKDTVMATTIAEDGSLATTWDTTSNPPLPFARSGFTVLTLPNNG
jgi:hypothetical protein